MIKITEEDKKILEQFPEYTGDNVYKGTKEYWSTVFEFETNRDPELHKAFSELHKKLVDEVIKFCKEHNLKNVNEFTVSADGLMGSIEYGQWGCCTDSSMSMIQMKEDKKTGWLLPDRENPFLYEI